jgi:hypothetical protein
MPVIGSTANRFSSRQNLRPDRLEFAAELTLPPVRIYPGRSMLAGRRTEIPVRKQTLDDTMPRRFPTPEALDYWPWPERRLP